MEILHIAAEAVPFAKTGGLADVAGVLSQVMAASETTSLMLPEYATETIRGLAPDIVDTFTIQIGRRSVEAAIKKIKTSSRLSVYFVSQDHFFARKFLYGDEQGDYPDNFHRFLFFQKAVVEWIRRQETTFDIVHCHDWQTALIPLLLKLQSTAR